MFQRARVCALTMCLWSCLIIMVVSNIVSVSFSTVLKRQVSPEELQTPGGPFLKKTFTVGHTQIHTCTHTHTRKKTQTKTTSAWMSPPMLRGHIFPPHTHTYRYISTSGTSTHTLFFFSICTLSQITWSPHWHKSLSSRNHKSLTDANFGSGQILTVCIQNSNYSYMYKMNRVFFPKIIPK